MLDNQTTKKIKHLNKNRARQNLREVQTVLFWFQLLPATKNKLMLVLQRFKNKIHIKSIIFKVTYCIVG